MRDGVTLFTTVYTPGDASRAFPILLHRDAVRQRRPTAPTPTPARSDRPRRFENDGFIFVYQDVRGQFRSDGEFVEMRPHAGGQQGPAEVDETTDTYDTVAWLLEHIPGHNGRVGMWGISYPGFYAAAALPARTRRSRQSRRRRPIADLFMGDDSYHNGAFMLAANFSFYAGFLPRPGGRRRPDDAPAFRLRNTGRLRLLSRRSAGSPRASARRFPKGECLLGREPRAHDLRRVLAGARDRAAPARHDAGGAHRRRLVRRRGSGRAAAHLSRHRAARARGATTAW